MAMNKNKKKQRAAAFVNWDIALKNGTILKSDRGFPIFQNPEYPNAKEDLLVEAAGKSKDNVLITTMQVRIALNSVKEETPIKAKDLF